MASRGHRVIACAQALLPEEQYPLGYPFSKNDVKYPSSGYCFVGLVSLEDPPKHGVREAIGKLRLAGIKVMMVTGLLAFRFLSSFNSRFPRRSPENSGGNRAQNQSDFGGYSGNAQRED